MTINLIHSSLSCLFAKETPQFNEFSGGGKKTLKTKDKTEVWSSGLIHPVERRGGWQGSKQATPEESGGGSSKVGREHKPAGSTDWAVRTPPKGLKTSPKGLTLSKHSTLPTVSDKTQ